MQKWCQLVWWGMGFAPWTAARSCKIFNVCKKNRSAKQKRDHWQPMGWSQCRTQLLEANVRTKNQDPCDMLLAKFLCSVCYWCVQKILDPSLSLVQVQAIHSLSNHRWRRVRVPAKARKVAKMSGPTWQAFQLVWQVTLIVTQFWLRVEWSLVQAPQVTPLKELNTLTYRNAL